MGLYIINRLKTFQTFLVGSLIWFGNLFHSLGYATWKDLSPYIAFSLVYTLRSDRLDTMVLFHLVLSMRETGFCVLIWNVQEASAAGTKLVLDVPFCECVSPDVQHHSVLAVGDQRMDGLTCGVSWIPAAGLNLDIWTICDLWWGNIYPSVTDSLTISSFVYDESMWKYTNRSLHKYNR